MTPAAGRAPAAPTYADDAGEPGWASTMRMGSQAMRDFSAGSAAAGGTADGDSSAQLERLQRLREQGALTQAEFEAQKRRIPGR